MASKTVESVQMLKCGLEMLQQVLESHGYDALNLLSCMTLDVANIHSVVHHKDPLCTVLDYTRNFGNAAKEGLKKTTHWVPIYFTSPKSWYPVPERAMFLSAKPVIQPFPAVPMTPQCVQVLRDWAQTFGAAARQRSVRQETAMSRAGTLPSYLYQREVRPGESVSLERSGEQWRNEPKKQTRKTAYWSTIQAVAKIWMTSQSFSTNNDEADDDVGGIPSLDREETFLLGTIPRFGRTVRFNSRIIV